MNRLGPNEVVMDDGTVAPRILWEPMVVRRRKWRILRRMTKQRYALLAMLRELEWVKGFWSEVCPVCGGPRRGFSPLCIPAGHAPGCRLRELLDACALGKEPQLLP